MPPLVPLADVPKAIMDRLRASPDLMDPAWTAGRIGGNWRTDWPHAACSAILVLGDTSGGEASPGLMYADIPIACYGKDRRLARALWAMMQNVLIPPDGGSAFSLAHAEVIGVDLNGGPAVTPEQDTGWWVAMASYRFYYGNRPV